MTDDSRAKVTFASTQWIEAAREILTDLAARHGAPGDRFSLCERFTGAPAEVSPSGVAAWYFRLDGASAEVGAGEIADADATVDGDYVETLPVARLVYTPEILAERRAMRKRGELKAQQGDWSRAPSYLSELHNRLAVITA